MTLSFTVLGIARPKGSMRAFVPKGWTRPILTSDNKSVKGWEESVRYAIQEHAAGFYFVGPLTVRIEFELPKPKSMAKRIADHIKKPDVDKLARGSLDAMKGVLWDDDSQITDLHVTKIYATGQPLARIEVQGEIVSNEDPSAEMIRPGVVPEF